jgi:Methyltransferase domain
MADGELSQAVRDIEGMSGQKYRLFINNFVRSLPDIRYLEIGSGAGSTVAAALHRSSTNALCIDNWSQFGGLKSKFLANIELVRSAGAELDLIERDFRAVDYSSIGIFDAYLFDGPHEEADQYDGITLVQPALASIHLLVVDDWNWRQVRLGTLAALRDANCSIQCSIEIRTTLNDEHPQIFGAHSDWHNGYFIAVICRASQSSERAAGRA